VGIPSAEAFYGCEPFSFVWVRLSHIYLLGFEIYLCVVGHLVS